MNEQIEELELYVNQLWADGLSSDLIKNLPLEIAFQDKRLVGIYMTQVYHYAVHTPRHQALVGVNRNNTNVKYMQYCFEHALEETGHELMALSDLRSLGFDIDATNMPGQLTSTNLLISFLYQEAQSAFPIQHLGYGFWSENACPFITEFMDSLMVSMGLKKGQMTFYSNHVTIDEGHANEVRKIVQHVVKTDEDWEGLKRVAKVSFDLTLGIIRDSYNAYQDLIEGKDSKFIAFK